MRLFGFEKAPKESGRDWNVVSLAPGSSSGAGGAVVVTAMAVIVVWILAFILMCSMIFRSFALILLAAVAPVALMLMPWEKTQSWARRWGEIVVALLIAKPLAATVLAVAIKLFAESKSFAGLSAGVVGMALACGAPLMALRLVSFAGGELAAAAQTAGGGHVLSRSSGFAARQISRQTGGRFTLAALASRSAMSRPIQSSKAQFPTRALPPRVPLPGQITGAAPARASGGNAAALMLDGGTPGQGAPFRRARSDVRESSEVTPGALLGSSPTARTGERSEPHPKPPPSAASTASPTAPAPPPPLHPQTTAKPPIDSDDHA